MTPDRPVSIAGHPVPPGPEGPGWHPDPCGRHRWRWRSPDAWSTSVSDDGVSVSTDWRSVPPGRPTQWLAFAEVALPFAILLLMILVALRG